MLHGLHEAFHDANGLLVAALLGQARIAGQVGEADSHAHTPLLGNAAGEVGLHVTDHVLLDEVPEKAPMQVAHERRGERQKLAGETLHRLGHLHAGKPSRIIGSCT